MNNFNNNNNFNETFYENLLKNFLCDNSIKISTVVREDLVAKGNNFLSSVVKVICKGSKSGSMNNCLLKEPFQYEFVVKEKLQSNTEIPFLSVAIAAFENEYVCYKEILPALNRFAARPIPAPHCFFANDDVIVLENLSLLGFKCVDKTRGIDFDFVLVVLKEIANLHAASLIMQEKHPELYTSLLSKLRDFIFSTSTINPCYATQEQSLDLAIELMESDRSCNGFQIGELKKFKGESFSMQARLIQNRSGRRSVITHGDLWCNNIMLNNNITSNDKAINNKIEYKIDNKNVKLIDFQAMRATSLAADLTYFLYVCADPPDRQRHLPIFLNTYLDELHSCLMQSNVDLRNELTFDWLKDEMKDFAFFGFMHGMWLLPLRLQENKDNTFENYETKGVGNLSAEYRSRLLDLIHEYFSLTTADLKESKS